MIPIERTPLWKEGFVNGKALNEPHDQNLVDRYKQVLIAMREKVGRLAARIENDMPGLTVHDLTHLDALWEMASLVYTKEQKINPTELFILGAAMLIHDAGLTLAAYPNGVTDLQHTQEWQDSIATERLKLNNPDLELPSDANMRCQWRTLRILHAKRAEQLLSLEWHVFGQTIYLLEDSELRNNCGELIGKIAASHHWTIERIESEFQTPLGALPSTPGSWTIDGLKLACLLRLADALHLDSRRAPLFLCALQHGETNDHWNYQSRMNKPYADGDKIFLTSARRFEKDTCEAWWLCYDWAQMIDAELKGVDKLLKKTRRETMQCQGIAHIESPEAFAKTVRVSGWTPVNVQLHVGDVCTLVNKLGGSTLYGKDEPLIAVRELVQNACDAVRAKRLLVAGYEGCITISLDEKSGVTWLSVEDDGIGMSSRILSQSLLDFGKSFWSSEEIQEEHPGLISKGFEPEGHFGIGFFSIFMLGNHVRVTSRRYDRGYLETYTLEFMHGLSARPILYPDSGTVLTSGGTCVSVALRDIDPIDHIGYQLTDMFPALCVTLKLRYKGKESIIVHRDDWLSLEPYAFFDRTEQFWNENLRMCDFDDFPLVPIEMGGNILGRSSVTHSSLETGIIVDRLGIKICPCYFFAGIIKGVPTNAARTEGRVHISKDALVQWANQLTKQYQKLEINDISKKMHAATQIYCAGGELNDLPIISYRGNPMNQFQLEDILQNIDNFYIFSLDVFDADEMRFYTKNKKFANWINREHVFRISSPYLFYTNHNYFDVNDILEISKIGFPYSGENPLVEFIGKKADIVWESKVKRKEVKRLLPTFTLDMNYRWTKGRAFHFQKKQPTS